MSRLEENKQKSKEICHLCEGMLLHNAIEAISLALVAQIMGAIDNNQQRADVAQIAAHAIVGLTKRLINREKNSGNR